MTTQLENMGISRLLLNSDFKWGKTLGKQHEYRENVCVHVNLGDDKRFFLSSPGVLEDLW